MPRRRQAAPRRQRVPGPGRRRHPLPVQRLAGRPALAPLVRPLSLALLMAATLLILESGAPGAAPAQVVVFWEDNFPAADSAAPTRTELASLLPFAKLASRREFAQALATQATRLTVLPFG